MRVILQRVSEAAVAVDGLTTGQIGRGLLILLGVAADDSDADLKWIADKLIQMRIFPDAEGKMNLSVQDVGGGLLVVSQFTLYANCKKGNRPSFVEAAPPTIAIPIYERFVEYLKTNTQLTVQTGVFGADMKVSLLNDGPVTIVLDSRA